MNNGATRVARTQFCYSTLARSKCLRDDTDEFIGNVTRTGLQWLVLLAIDFLGDYFRTTNLQLKAFTSHVLNKNCQLQFSTTSNAGHVG